MNDPISCYGCGSPLTTGDCPYCGRPNLNTAAPVDYPALRFSYPTTALHLSGTIYPAPIFEQARRR